MVTVDLSDYGYVNARVRGMRAHLLTRDFFMRLVEADDFDTLHGLMEQTVYRREISEAVLLDPERPDYEQALNVNLVASLRLIYESTGGHAHRLVATLFSDYDVYNIKTILRGKRGDATPGEIMKILSPVGVLRMDTLEQLAREPDVQSVVARMEDLNMKYARPAAGALKDYIEHDKDLSVLELALDRFHFRDVFDSLQGKDKNTEMVRTMFKNEVDMRNISTLVRIRGLRLEEEDVKDFCLPGGTLDPAAFLRLYNLGEIESIVGEYPDPAYRRLLKRALEQYQELDVVAFDRELERALIKLGAAMSNVDVLGIGVIIGFMWLKKNEIINLRIVLKGKLLEQPQAELKKDLFFVEREDREVA